MKKKQFKELSNIKPLIYYPENKEKDKINKEKQFTQNLTSENNVKPLIFKNKSKNIIKSIPFNLMPYASGYVRHFPPASLEWNNSVYSYNNNYNKLLTYADINLIKAVKSYFGLRYKRKLANKKIKKSLKSHTYLKRFHTSGRKYVKKLRLSTVNRILVSKASVKHTSNSAIITLFIYNSIKYKLLETVFEIIFSKWKDAIINGKIVRRKVYITRLSYFYCYKLNANNNINKINSKTKLLTRKVFKKYFITIPKLLKSLLLIYKLNLNLNKLYDNERSKSKLALYNFYFRDYIGNPLDKLHLLKNKQKFLMLKFRAIKKKLLLEKKYIRFIKYIMLNDKKFEKRFLENFRKLASKLYNKNVTFNIINLGKYYLNSQIFTEIVTLKLKNRRYSVPNLLSFSLNNINIPKVSLPKSKKDLDIKKLWINKINIHIFDILAEKINNEHWLDNTIFKNRPLVNPLSLFAQEKIFNDKLLNKFLRRVYKTIRHKKLSGIRLRASGRLTKRFKASRAICKSKWIGGLRNKDSSFLGLSTVMLRGYLESNIDYSVMSNKRRIGAYGVKGWVSSM